MTTVGVAIPCIPPRAGMLQRALASVLSQERLPDAISVVIDHDHQGAAATRNRAWRMLDTDWVAFLDDDDELLLVHLDRLLACALEHDADLVYSWYVVVGGTDPFPGTFGRPWDPTRPVQTTITVLWRRTALEKLDGFTEQGDDRDIAGIRQGEDFDAVCRLNEQGGRIVHLPERTWIWHHHGYGTPGVSGNTSGRPDRW